MTRSFSVARKKTKNGCYLSMKANTSRWTRLYLQILKQKKLPAPFGKISPNSGRAPLPCPG